jgi:ABC-type nitrate/sulfonate/bicarbonate transport system substrate-binding protein
MNLSALWNGTRAVISAALLLAATAPLACAADAIEQKDVDIAVVRDPQLGAQMAIANYYGYFKDEGLNVTIHWNQSGADIITVMAGGSAPLAAGSMFGQVLFVNQGLPIRTIAALADISEAQGFVLSPGVKLSSPKELEGKKLAFTQGSPSPLLLAKLAKLFGFDMAKVQLVNMNQPEGIIAASKGEVDGLLGWQPNLYRLIKLGGTPLCDRHGALCDRQAATIAGQRSPADEPFAAPGGAELDRRQAQHAEGGDARPLAR